MNYKNNEDARLKQFIAQLEMILQKIQAPRDHSLHRLRNIYETSRRPNRIIDINSMPAKIEIDLDHKERAQELVASIEKIMIKMFARFVDEASASDLRQLSEMESSFPMSGVWSLGQITYRLESRRFLRGSIELRKTEPVLPISSADFLYYSLAIPGIREKLTRENHGDWGYHYHYIDSNDRRSDALLSFNHKSPDPANPILFWETHAKEGKFKAKVDRWGTDKRRSVYSACHPDTLNFDLSKFKKPSSKSKTLWPET